MEQELLRQLHTNHTIGVEAFGESRQGGRAENQDNYWGMDTKFGFLITVCDGMGGGPGGRTASTIAVREILNGVINAPDDEDPVNVVVHAICSANIAIYNYGIQDVRFRGMGSTCTVALITKRSAIVAHVGDSRVYQLRHHRKVFRTFDHSMVFDLVRQKVITEEQARLSAQSNVITRALGIKPDIEVEYCERPYSKGDLFVLCSDGIHGTMPEPQLVKLLTQKYQSLAAMVDNVATIVDNFGATQGGGHDNLTLVAARINNTSKLKEKMTKQAQMIIALLSVLLLCSISLNIYQACDNDEKPSIQQDAQTHDEEQRTTEETPIDNKSVANEALGESTQAVTVQAQDKTSKPESLTEGGEISEPTETSTTANISDTNNDEDHK